MQHNIMISPLTAGANPPSSSRFDGPIVKEIARLSQLELPMDPRPPSVNSIELIYFSPISRRKPFKLNYLERTLPANKKTF